MQRLREQTTSRANVAAVWEKAVQSAHDAELGGMSIDGSLRAAYDAGHMAALALLAVHGLRTSSGRGHHEMAFAGAEALGGSALADLIPDSQEIRGLRSSSMYDAAIAGPKERLIALKWMQQTLPAIRAALIAVDASLSSMLIEYP